MKTDSRNQAVTDDEKTVATSAEPIDRIARRLHVASEILQSLDRQIMEASLIRVTHVARATPQAVGAKLVIGRSDSATWPIDDRSLSRHHFEIVQTPHGCLLRDLKSHNGTRVNDAQCSERWLVDGDMICAGRQAFLFLERMEEHDA